MKKLILILILIIYANGKSELEIISDNFEADENTMITKFSGHVHIKKDKDTLDASKVTVFFDTKRKPLKIIAKNNAKIEMYLKENHFKGSADTITYKPKEQKYIFTGNAFLHDIETNKKIYGDTLIADQKNGKYKVEGSAKKPVKFLFSID